MQSSSSRRVSLRLGRPPAFLYVVGAALVPLLAIAGCSGNSAGGTSSGGSGGEKVTIRFQYLWGGPEGAAIEKLVSDFNGSQDKIVVKGVSNPDTQAQTVAMASKNGSFDISDSFGSDVASLAAKGALEPLDGYIAKDKYDTSDFVVTAMDQMKYKDKTYSLPLALHAFQIMYNKKLFAAANITEPPKTTSQWADAIAKLSKVENGSITRLGMSQTDLITSAWVFGGDWYDKDNKPTPDNAGNVAAAQFLDDNIISKYGAAKIKKFTSGFGEYASAQNPFYQGKVAMAVDGEWQSAFTKQYAPNLAWGVFPFPYPDGRPELENTTQTTASTLFIPTNSKHKAEAWTFMKFMLDKTSMLSWTHAVANLPSRTSLLDDKTYSDLPQFSSWLQLLKSPNLHVFSSTGFSSQYMTDLGTAADGILGGTKAPNDAFAEVAAKAKSYAP